MIQQLDRYRTPPVLVRTLWFCAGAPLLSARWLPGSAWRVTLLRAFGAQIGSGCRLKSGLLAGGRRLARQPRPNHPR